MQPIQQEESALTPTGVESILAKVTEALGAGRIYQAAKILDTNIPLMMISVDANHPLVAEALRMRCFTLLKRAGRARVQESRTRLVRAAAEDLDLAARILDRGPQDDNFIMTLMVLGSLLNSVGRFKEGQRHLERAIAILRSKAQDSRPDLCGKYWPNLCNDLAVTVGLVLLGTSYDATPRLSAKHVQPTRASASPDHNIAVIKGEGEREYKIPDTQELVARSLQRLVKETFSPSTGLRTGTFRCI